MYSFILHPLATLHENVQQKNGGQWYSIVFALNEHEITLFKLQNRISGLLLNSKIALVPLESVHTVHWWEEWPLKIYSLYNYDRQCQKTQ